MRVANNTTEQPATMWGKLRTTCLGGGIVALGIWMMVRPESPFRAAIERGEPVRVVISVIDWIWSIPAGIVLVLLALVVVGYEFMPRRTNG
jgi:hypothetical protein